MTSKRLSPEELAAIENWITPRNGATLPHSDFLRLFGHIAALEQELKDANKAVDDNWVTHRQMIHARTDLAAAQARIEKLRRVVMFADSLLSEDRMKEEALSYCVYQTYLSAREALAEGGT